jgi:heme oxygenase
LKKHILKLDEKDGEWDSADGLNFYYFNNLGNQAEFKNFYRERLNAAKVTAKTRGKTRIKKKGACAHIVAFRTHCGRGC